MLSTRLPYKAFFAFFLPGLSAAAACAVPVPMAAPYGPDPHFPPLLHTRRQRLWLRHTPLLDMFRPRPQERHRQYAQIIDFIAIMRYRFRYFR